MDLLTAEEQKNIKKLTAYIESIIDADVCIDPHESLFSIGFDSMRIMALSNRLRSEGYQLTFSKLIENPTLASWAKFLTAEKKDERTFTDIVTTANDSKREFPLAPMQHAYWIGAMDKQLLGNVSAHLYVEFDGENINPLKLSQAVEEIIKRHEMLRVEILHNGQQRIVENSTVEVFSLIDLSKHAVLEVNQQLDKIRVAKSNQRILREQGKVIDITLTLLPNGKSRLQVDVDMIAADAMSYRLLMDELARVYANTNNSSFILPELRYSYREYILTKNNNIPFEYEEDKKWWHKKIASFPNPPNLPIKTNKDLTESSQAIRFVYWVSAQQRANIELFAQKNKVTVAMSLATAFADAIGSHCQQKTFFLNLPLFNREQFHEDVDYLVGDFSSSVLLDIDLSEKKSILARIKDVSSSFISNVTHASYSALEVLRDLSKYRGVGVLAPIVYTSAINLGELFSENVRQQFGKPVWILSQGPQVLLDAQVTEFDGGFLLNWDVRADLFQIGVVETMFENYKNNIQKLTTLQLNSADFFESICIENQIKARNTHNRIVFKTSNKVLHENFFEFVKIQADKPALFWKENKLNYQYTYKELADLSLTVSAYLIAQGVKKNSKVAISLLKGPKQVIALLAILAIGASYIPIGIKQPDYRKNRILNLADTNFYLIENETFKIENENIQHILLQDCLNYNEMLATPVFPAQDSIAYTLFTSGSTGEPKGVEISHKAVMNTLEVVNHIFNVKSDDIGLAFSSLEFDLSIQDIFGLFNVGANVFMLDEITRYDPDYWVDQIVSYQITQLYGVPSMLEMLLSAKTEVSLPSLKVVILGGDKISPNLFYELKRRSPNCRFAGLGGATETAIHCTYFEVNDHNLNQDWSCIPYGYPLYNMSCRVVDELGNDCANWVIGELWVSGIGLANGYIDMPEISQEKFIIDGQTTWYRTSDLVRYTDTGIIEYIGRADNQVKVRGYRIEIDEIEGVLNRIKGIKNAVVLVIKDQGINLISFIQFINDKVQLDEISIKNQLQKYLPPYMIPEQIIPIQQLPITSNAKIDRNALIELYKQARISCKKTYPETSLARLVAEQFIKFTGVESVALEDDFFALGGDSVLATKLISSLRDELDFDKIAIADLFETKTLAAFVARLVGLEDQKGLLEKTAEIMLELNETVSELN